MMFLPTRLKLLLRAVLTSFSLRPQFFTLLLLLLLAPLTASAADMTEIERLYQSGQYEKAAEAARQQIEARRYGDAYRIWLSKSQLALGQYEEAEATTREALKPYPWSLPLRLIAREALLKTGQPEQAELQMTEIIRLIRSSPRRFSDAKSLVACGEALLLMGAEPRDVLLKFYDRAKQENPGRPDAYLAIGNMALDKHDDALAAEEFRAALKQSTDNPDVHYGLARALLSSDLEAAQQSLQAALELNPRHIPSLLLQVDRLVEAEQFDDAEALIAEILDINPRQSEAWAYRAVLAHFAADPKAEQISRAAARGRDLSNPRVDHLIGRKLSSNYRFREGAAYQRRALEIDAEFAPATIQLSQDLLRLGEETEGWRLAKAGFEQDGYDVVSYNLLTLQENLSKFRTLEDEDFILRMETREANVFGTRVLELLHRAKKTLCKKYGLELNEPVVVEMFPDQGDFAVRTFGLPGGAGYLGVCFGNVITANSPTSSSGQGSNWESVLWHEFCHTVTLNLTKNKMPRWFSEGISVYEEGQEDSRWGQRMTPQYRQWILEGHLTPIHDLSSAFMSPPSGAHLLFAYYQSSLVVEYLVETYGLETVQEILHDLGAGIPMNVALERRTDGLAALEDGFLEFAQSRAAALAPDADWSEPRRDETGVIQADATDPEKQNNIAILRERAGRLLNEQKWEAAKEPLKKLLKLYPNDVAANNAYVSLAAVHRKLDETDQEAEVLEELASRSGDSLESYLRLLSLAEERKDWRAVEKNAIRAIAVNPMLPGAYNLWGRACRELGHQDQAVAAYRASLAIEADAAIDANYHLAHLLQHSAPAEAKQHLLRALEEAPRFREAHRLLLKLHRRVNDNKKVPETTDASP